MLSATKNNCNFPLSFMIDGCKATTHIPKSNSTFDSWAAALNQDIEEANKKTAMGPDSIVLIKVKSNTNEIILKRRTAARLYNTDPIFYPQKLCVKFDSSTNQISWRLKNPITDKLAAIVLVIIMIPLISMISSVIYKEGTGFINNGYILFPVLSLLTLICIIFAMEWTYRDDWKFYYKLFISDAISAD